MTRTAVSGLRRSPSEWLGVTARGLAMGAVEVVPGVSGGTIAFVTGIYDELVSSLASFGPASFKPLFQGRWRDFAVDHNLGFLIALAGGMAVGVLVFARLMQWALAALPTVVWALFTGIIVGAVVKLASQYFHWRWLFFMFAGLAASIAVVLLEPSSVSTSFLVTFACGFLAVSAWLLPAISGSFILLLLGQYQRVLEAINGLNFEVLGALALGCVAGLLTISRALAWALGRWRGQVFNVLLGFMAGSLIGLWPWRHQGDLLSPIAFETASGEPAHILLSLVAGCVGAGAIWWIAED